MFSGLIGLVIAAVIVWCGTMIARKAGHSPWWALVLLVPIANLALVWVFAFSRWPLIDGPQTGGSVSLPPSS